MKIKYSEPLERAYKRMKAALLKKPLNFNKWFAVGFTAFLAGAAGGGGSGGNWGNFGRHGGKGDLDVDKISEFPAIAWQWLLDHPVFFALIVIGVLMAVAFGVVVTWLNARGQFMFLDNVVHDRDLIKKPWADFKDRGNSLFVWNLLVGFLGMVLVFTVIVIGVIVGLDLYRQEAGPESWIPFVLVMGLLFLVISIGLGYVGLFTKSFVVPIMYKHQLAIIPAWKRFLTLFSQHKGHFLLYGVFEVFLSFAAVMGIIMLGFLTCCIGLFIFSVPYIGTVATLPVWYTLRGLSLEYLAQFGPDYDLFPQQEPVEAELLA